MRVAVTWQMCGYVDIDAPTVEEAMEEFLDNRDTIPLPEDGKYIEGTFKLGIDDPELQKMFADIPDQGEPVQTEAVECCPHCGGENVFPNRDVKKQGYIAKCQHCGEGIFLCDECLHAEDNTGRLCDWHEEAHGSETWGVCFRGTIRHQADTSAGDTPAAATQGTVAFHGDDMTRVYRQCGGTKFASGHKVSVECVVDGSGRLIRFLQSDVADVEEDCENGMIAGPFVCLSCFHEGKTLEEITVEKEHPSIGACLIKKSGDRGLDGAEISRMMQELGEAEVYPVEFPAVGHESSAMGFITAGRKYCTRDVKKWLVKCEERRKHPVFPFASDLPETDRLDDQAALPDGVVPVDRIKKAIYRIHEAGGCDATDKYGQGYDDAIVVAVNILLDEFGLMFKEIEDYHDSQEQGL